MQNIHDTPDSSLGYWFTGSSIWLRKCILKRFPKCFRCILLVKNDCLSYNVHLFQINFVYGINLSISFFCWNTFNSSPLYKPFPNLGSRHISPLCYLPFKMLFCTPEKSFSVSPQVQILYRLNAFFFMDTTRRAQTQIRSLLDLCYITFHSIC